MPDRQIIDLGGGPVRINQGTDGLAGGGLQQPSTDWFTRKGGIKGIASMIGGFTKSGASSLGINSSNWGSIAGDAISGLGSMIGNKYGEDFSDSQKSTQSLIRQGLSMIPVYGQAIAAATGALDAIGNITGTNLSNINKDSASRAGISFGAGFNNTINYLPGVSALAGGFGLWSGRTNNYKMSDEAEELQASYSGTIGDLRAAEDVAGKRMLFQRGKANSFIDEAKNNDKILAQINQTNTMRKQSDYYQDLQHQNINRYAGQNYLGVRIGKQGTKLMSIEQVRAIIQSNHQKETEKLQNGGIIGTPGIDSSVMPVGSLHKELHHIEDANPELAEEITRKGIPVVTVDENGEFQQVAEVERDEIIFSKSITDEIERLRKIGDDDAMIECGKLITNEIINNTSDPKDVIENG